MTVKRLTHNDVNFSKNSLDMPLNEQDFLGS